MGELKFKSDIEMWHKVKEFADTLVRIASISELHELHKCRFYEFDEASEEVCHNPKVKTNGDFDGTKECWKCEHRELKKTRSEVI